MSQHLYRFRKTILGEHQELQNQTIYCSSLETLNDPMEGFKDLFWSGDTIVWRNLLKHYVLCLEHACILLMLNGNATPIDLNSLPVLGTENDLPTEEYRASFRNSCEIFFNTSSVPECIDGLASRQRPVRRDELCACLRMLHCHALNAIARSYSARGIVFGPFDDGTLGRMWEMVPIRPEIFASTNDLEQRHPDVAGGSEPLWAAISAVHLQTVLIGKYNNAAYSSNRNGLLVFTEFPDCYVKLIERMVQGDWYMACFAADYRSSSMWGHYADSHKGVCLKFRTGDGVGNHSLRLKGVVGLGNSRTGPASVPVYGQTTLPLYKVIYNPAYPEIDFFRSLGRLRGQTVSWWYSDEHGNTSPCARDVFQNAPEWRDRYWQQVLAGQTTKLEDWRYEDEYRVVLSELDVVDYSSPANRTLTYAFSDLKGIIFGINTPEHCKLEMIRIVQEKSIKEGRKDFELYQAYYAKSTGRIEAARLDLIKL